MISYYRSVELLTRKFQVFIFTKFAGPFIFVISRSINYRYAFSELRVVHRVRSGNFAQRLQPQKLSVRKCSTGGHH